MTRALIVVDFEQIHPTSKAAISQAKVKGVYVWMSPLFGSPVATKNRLLNMLLLQGKEKFVIVDGDREFSWEDVDSMFQQLDTQPAVCRGPSFIAATREWLEQFGRPGAPHSTEFLTDDRIDGMLKVGGALRSNATKPSPSKATVGIVVTFHNQAEYREKCLESVFAQSRPFTKVVVVDDASEEEIPRSPNAINVRTEVKDRCKARNIGARYIHTEYIVFLDGDNWLSSTFLEELLKGIGQNIAVVYPSLAIHAADGSLNEGATTPTRPYSPDRLRLGNLAETTSLVRLSAFWEAGRWPEASYDIEDWELWINMMHLGFDLKYMPEAVLHYRRVNFHSDSLSILMIEGSMARQDIVRIDEFESVRGTVHRLNADRFVMGRGTPTEELQPRLIEKAHVVAGPADQWRERIAAGAVPGEMATVVCFFSPVGYQKPKENFRIFRNAFKGPLYIVEGLFGDQAPSIADALHIRAEDVLWHKESLINHLIASLPKNVTKVAWVDGDLLFPDGWHVEVSKALENHPIVQCFKEAVMLACDGSVLNTRTGAAAALALGHKNALNFNESHPGFAWAARRSVIEDIGLFDRHVTGGADSIMAFGMLGLPFSDFFLRMYNDHFLAAMRDWKEMITERVGGNVGFVDCKIRHLWHGSREDRRYVQRIEMLRKIHPERDLVRDGPLWKWEEGVDVETRNAIRDYFTTRKEDNDTPT